VSKTTIRAKTGNFLDKLQSKTISYGFHNQEQYYTSAVNTLTGLTDIVVVNEHKALTGAAPAILPMEIVTARINRNEYGEEVPERISFTLLINPETWNHGKTQTTQMAYTRNGWSTQLWGPNQDTISSTGKTAAFMTPAEGMDNFTSQLSFGYLNFMALISSYKNNGYHFEDFIKVDELTRVIKTVQGIQITYDNEVFMGHFNNFTIDEVEETPYLLNYNFEFIVSTLNGTEYEVSGHYKTIPTSEEDLITGTASDPSALVFAADPYVKKPSFPTAPPRPTDDKTTIRLWERITGLSWTEAFNLKMTDGSVKGNLKLRQDLIGKRWNSFTKTFV
jgi:hypothetical protein